MRETISILISIIFLVTSTVAQEYNFLDITVREGLPQSQINAITQDAKGYLWLGSYGGGLARYDGLTIDRITTREGLPSDFINVLTKTSDNNIWIGTNTGYARLENGVIIETHKSELSIYSFAVSSDDVLWIGSHKGLYEYNIKEGVLRKKKIHPILDQSKINNILTSKEYTWVASSKGLYKIKGAKVIRYELIDGLLSKDIKDIHIDNQDRIWVVQYDGGLSAFSQDKFQLLYQFTNPSIRQATDIAPVNTDELWLSTENAGIQKYNLETRNWNTINKNNGLPSNWIHTAYQDQWTNIWLATNNIGLSKYLGKSFKSIKPINTNERSITALSANSKNEMSYAFANNKVGHIAQDGSNKTANIELPSKITDLRHSEDDALWISTSNSGLAIYDSLILRRFTTSHGMPSNAINGTKQDNYYNTLIATNDRGIWRIDSIRHDQVYTSPISINAAYRNASIDNLTKDHNGNIWCTINKGLIGTIVQDSIIVYGRNNGIPNLRITDIAFDQHSNIWISTAGAGIYYALNNHETLRFRKPTITKGFIDNNIKSLVFDSSFDLWIASTSMISKATLNPTGHIEQLQHYGKNEGFQGLENIEGQSLQDLYGRLWIGTIDGMFIYSPTQIAPSESTPITSISKILINNIPLDTHITNKTSQEPIVIKLEHSQNDISITFNSVDLNQARDIRHSWILVGKDDEWINWASAQNINYSNLAPGDYTFKVKAQNVLLNESRSADFNFAIQPALWQIKWIQVLSAALLLLSLILLYHRRLTQVRKKESQKRAALELKSNLITLEQKALQLQMNPHFIFNALNSIQSLIIKEKNSEARIQLLNFSNLMRGILNNSKKESITLNEEINMLKLYLTIEKECNNGLFEYEIIDNTSMDIEEIEIPPMLIQPFIENAVIHGLSQKKTGGMLSIEFNSKGRLLTIDVIDNGIGREAASNLQHRNTNHTSSAIAITQKRLDALKNKISYKPLRIHDLYEDDGHAGGTRVEIIIPYQINF